MPRLVRTLLERRVPHVLAIYAGASWGVVEFVSFAVDEFLLSPHWTRVALVALLLLLPTALMLAWFHGKPGREVEGLARTEKIGIPANVVLCGAVLWMLFGGEDLGAATTSVTVETEDGEVIEREVAKAEFRKRTVLFPLDPGAGLDEDDSWLAYAVPSALVADAWLEEASSAIAPMVLSQMRAADLDIYLDAGWLADATDFLNESKARIPPPFDSYLVPYLESRLALASGDLEAARGAHDATHRVAQAMGHGELLKILQRLRGEIDEAGGDYQSAIAQYRAVMAMENPGPGLHRDLGRALGKAGRLDEAEAELREALRPIPAHPRTHFEIALVLEARGDAAGAVGHLKMALVAWETADEAYEPALEARGKLAELEG